MSSDDLFDESRAHVMGRKFRENPILLFGVTGFLITAVVGAYKYKTRPKGMSAPSFLVQLRVIAQSMVVGSLTVGVAYGMLNDYVFTKKKED